MCPDEPDPTPQKAINRNTGFSCTALSLTLIPVCFSETDYCCFHYFLHLLSLQVHGHILPNFSYSHSTNPPRTRRRGKTVVPDGGGSTNVLLDSPSACVCVYVWVKVFNNICHDYESAVISSNPFLFSRSFSSVVSVSLAVLRALKGEEGCLFKTPRRVSAHVNTLKLTAGLDN